MKRFGFAAACLLLGQSIALPVLAQRYQDDSPVGVNTNPEVKAFAAAWCRDNDYAAAGYASQQSCEDQIFADLSPRGDGQPPSRFDLPGGGEVCVYYGNYGQLLAGGC